MTRWRKRSIEAVRLRLEALLLQAPLLLQTFELDGGVVDEAHGCGNRAMAGHTFDEPVHLLAHTTIGRMALRRSPQLDDVHRLARVHLHDEANAIRHGNG